MHILWIFLTLILRNGYRIEAHTARDDDVREQECLGSLESVSPY